MFRLIKPTIKYKNEYLASERESARKGEMTEKKIQEMERDFKTYLLKMYSNKYLKKGYVPCTSYWMMNDNRFIGETTIRHRLNAKLTKEGGHVGYGIRPSERKKGYGTKILALALRKIKKMGIKKALITCDDDNVGSWKIIEANGGVLKDKLMNEGRMIRRYYINL